VVAGETKNYSFSEILNLTSHKQKSIRDAAVNAFNEILQKYSQTAENELNAVLYNKKIDDTLRNFPRPDSTRHLSDDVDTQMVDELIQAVSQRYNISQKFYELKAKLFKVPKLAYHERNVEYGEIDLNFPWPEAAGLVYDTLWSLDPLFAQIFSRFLEESRVDVFPKAGKDSGAFCAPTRSNLPVYVLLNHTDRLNDVRTLAHEMGHAINFELMKQENELNYDSSLFIAESCSTFIEEFVLEKIIQTSDEETKLTILMEKLNNDVSTIFRQVAFYRFELDLHQSFRTKGYLSYQEIGQLFQKHMSEYMGEFVSQDPGSENWWIYVGHFRNFFYVYSYAAGLLVSKFLQNQVRQNHAFMEQIKTYYATGTSQSPKNILAKIGVNVNSQLWNQGLDQVEELLNQTWWLAKKLQKIDT
jgi:oligoendopeptidase F